MRHATPVRYERNGWGESPAAIVAMGLALAVAGIVQTLGAPVSQPVLAFELFVSLLVPTGLATGGYWLASRDVSADVRWRAATRVSVGIVVACGLAAWLVGYVALEGGAIRDPLSLVTTLAAVGGATGFVTAVCKPVGIDATEASGPSATGATAALGSATVAESVEPSERSPATIESSTERTMERPTAAAVGATVATATVPSTDGDATTDASTASTGTTSTRESPETTETAQAEPQPSRPRWRNADPLGRTAAPARPAQQPERDVDVDESVEALGDLIDSHDPLDAPTPAREPGVDAVASVPSTAETVLEVLGNERDRLALAVLYHEWDGEERSVDALARAVSYHTDDAVEAVDAGLRHATLPRLREVRAVDWDPYADRVAAPDHAVFEEGVREAAMVLEPFEPGTR